jgi:VanZ family protein
MLTTLTEVFTGHPRFVRHWRIFLVLLLIVVLWLALTPAPPKRVNLGWDKLNHAAAFTTLAAVAVFAMVGPWIRIAIALLGYGALIEILQSFTPTRSAEWGDLLADGVGIGVGLLMAAVVVKTSTRLGAITQDKSGG